MKRVSKSVKARRMFSKWFPSPTGIMSSLVDEKKQQLTFKKESSDDESSDSDSVLSVMSSQGSDSSYHSSDSESSGVVYSKDSSDLSSEEFPKSLPIQTLTREIEELDEFKELDERSSVGNLKDTFLDVVPFLSNNGKTTHLVRSNGQAVPIDDHLYEKDLLICCVKLPVKSVSDDYDICRSLIDAYSELHRNSFEIVLVANMKRHFSFREDVFDAFFSAFQCLAVPFSDFDTRRTICSSINPRLDSIETILVDSKGHVRQHRMAPDHFHSFGSEWYPFTDECVEYLEIKDDILRMRLDLSYRKRVTVSPQVAAVVDSDQRPLSLFIDVFLCDPYHVLHRIDPAAGQPMEVSKLCEKHVGLYLCYDGDFMDTLNKVHKKCLAMKQELEIVLVGLPFSDDPMVYHQSLLEALKLSNITSWFLFSFEDNRKVCRRLWRVFARGRPSDRLVIFPPYNSGQPGEMEGRAVITRLGKNTYPFTASKVIDQTYNELKSLNPVSWFMDSRKKKRTCLVRNDSESYVRKSALVGKKLLLYLDSLRLLDDGEFCYLLMEHYDEIKASGCEVVFVPLDEKDVYLHEQHAIVDEMPWPIMPVQAALDASVIAQLYARGHDYWSNRLLVAVGEDGKILSKQAHRKLKKQGVTKSLFADTLYKEVARGVIELTVS